MKLKKCAMALSFLGLTGSVIPTAMAYCPDITSVPAANHLAIYNAYPAGVGTSWRLYIRPRNGASLGSISGKPWVKSPVGMAEKYLVPDGIAKDRPIEPGTKNNDDSYKSYITVDMPSALSVYNTYVTYAVATTIGWSMPMTAGGGVYRGMIVVAPTMINGVPSQATVDVKGVCFLQ